MPASAGGVVETFKNLLRHGKHHNHARQDNTPAPPSPAATDEQMSREAAEQIVKQEREQKERMPTYKGLENFKIVDKMGEKSQASTLNRFRFFFFILIFAAVKVVRKFELNASQDGDKHLNPKFKKKPRVTERANILKEVQIMRGTNHPSVVKLISFSESEEHYFLVLELMEGGELFHQIVKLTYFSENLSRHVILQVANGIRYLHEERGVVHRDIKPENLLFERIPIVPSKTPVHRPYDEEKEDEGEFIPGVGGGGIGRVKIADFGLSKVVWNEETMTPCGTVGYTAPEIVKDERYSKSVDMWALGCVLYTLLCGFPPFYDESINVLTEKVARGYYTFLSPWWDDISSSAKDLIQHLLCVDPAQRYTIDEFLAHPWCNAAPAPPPPPTPYIYGQSLDSPLLSAAKGRVEGRSPGIATLKEAFDITYAVHRMEEEGARRRKYKGRGGAGARGFLHGLNEDDEDEDEEMIEEEREKSKTAAAYADGRAGPRDRGRNAGTPRAAGAKGFELDMDGATLLGRRHRGKAGVGIRSPLAGNAMGMERLHISDDKLPPGSPMQIV
ncbi:Protein kinase domain-containing protein [Mycena sanguinolenta]|uniref:Protein kinase domain-containing protein n=1 Tax=Mycena sanguinolenta TaxID=230812 RepID=A0A8H7D0Q4_9AGAR|nr:Protein kinase domain-containing protein [Mycena sanguinolenta]